MATLSSDAIEVFVDKKCPEWISMALKIEPLKKPESTFKVWMSYRLSPQNDIIMVCRCILQIYGLTHRSLYLWLPRSVCRIFLANVPKTWNVSYMCTTAGNNVAIGLPTLWGHHIPGIVHLSKKQFQIIEWPVLTVEHFVLCCQEVLTSTLPHTSPCTQP